MSKLQEIFEFVVDKAMDAFDFTDKWVKVSNKWYDGVSEPWRFFIPIGLATLAMGVFSTAWGIFALFAMCAWRLWPVFSK